MCTITGAKFFKIRFDEILTKAAVGPETFKWVAAIVRNGWPESIGTGGRLRPESGAGFERNMQFAHGAIRIRLSQKLGIATLGQDSVLRKQSPPHRDANTLNALLKKEK